MSDARQAALLIQSEVVRQRVLGQHVDAVVLSPEMQLALEEARYGYWNAGPKAYSLFYVPVVVEPVTGGWAVRVSEE